MGNSQPTKLNIKDLPVDIFEVTDISLSSRSLTTGHGMTEVGTSAYQGTSCLGSFCFCTKRATEEESAIN
jgi:hypothetical protein